MWSQILILIVAFISVFFYSNRLPEQNKDLKIIGSLSFLLIFTIEAVLLAEFPFDQMVAEITAILLCCLLLVLLLLTIRFLRPEISRYPYGFAFIPLSVPLLYPFMHESEAIFNIILMMLQSCSLFVLSLLVIGHFDQFKRGWLAIISIISLLSAFLIYWVLPDFHEIEIWYWKPFIATGMFSLALSFPYLLTNK